MVYNKNHLGNARVSFGKNTQSQALEIVDANDYYPFGMNHLKTGNSFFGAGSYKNYKMQDQELQETGFYAYKWRNYMPDVGRFFNIDPLSEKYAYQSHYNFSENRVIDGRELEGLEWSGIHYKNSDGSEQIQYDVKYKVLNSSTNMTKEDIKIRTSEIVNQVEKTFSGSDLNGVSISTKVSSVEFVDSVDKKKDYYIDFVDKIEGGSSKFTIGKVDEIGNSQVNRIQVISILGKGSAEVATHESGHTLGLRHEVDPLNPAPVKQSMDFVNVMNSQSNGTNLTREQLSEIKKSVPTKTVIENENISPF